ncbi:MAG: hypothetical protein K6C36_07400 [Clostridia bacterium]|nr:hypothetical protein [Clostridia bacterium]
MKNDNKVPESGIRANRDLYKGGAVMISASLLLAAGRILTVMLGSNGTVFSVFGRTLSVAGLVNAVYVVFTLAAVVLLLFGVTYLKRFEKSCGVKSRLLTAARVLLIISVVYYVIQVLFGMNFVLSQILTLLSVFFSVPVALGLIDLFLFRNAPNKPIWALAGVSCLAAAAFTVFRFFYLFVFTYLEENSMVVFQAIRSLSANHAVISLAEYCLNAMLFVFVMICVRRHPDES